ncbi:ATP-binding protein [Pontibacter akesuensis]|uniref:histidine kinase n=1 Tax=Pontibacter akesuensis TaxID=388950 RepID=A0A1I7G168_9BACT|nr:ATP-binding protein [Pontibacter akesuensis]GHA59390.1 histidine kinase [Pontibacter akesuensis]SFU42202.1 Bacteriophytochrome (light-regulated signal transduction histidine kinase) [Pontibacter akesuensis]
MQNYNNLKVDLSNCDSEPIHHIGQIQPHGFLIILNQQSLQVEQVSTNIAAFVDVVPEDLIGHTLEKLCSGQGYLMLEKQLRNAVKLNPQLLHLCEHLFFGFIHSSEGKLVLECEPYFQGADQQRLENTQHFAQFQTQLNTLEGLGEQAQLVVNFVQQVLAYDRVMLYVFDEDWNGEVIAENVKDGVNSYLYHHFPASDIPAPARTLLEKKHVRQIPDVQAQPVKIIPYISPSTGAPSNILLSELRNPSEIHLEYLQNMGVHASLSFSILVKGKLWGLIACHHLSPIFIDYWKRQVCYLVAKAFANAIMATHEKRDLDIFELYKQREEALVQQLNKSGDISQGLFSGDLTLLDITQSASAAIYINNQLTRTANAPEEHEVMAIIEWLAEHRSDRVFSTRTLSKLMPGAEAFQNKASGLLALEISRYNKEYILYFKPEIRETITWAGNPEKPMTAKTEARIHPRKSFKNWEEIVKGKSHPWTLNELEITQILLKDLTAILLRNQADQLKNLNKDLRNNAHELQTKNRRLEDFAHIITHNLRSPLSNMKGLYNLYQAEPSQKVASEVMSRMHVVVENMSETIHDLNLLLKSALDQQTDGAADVAEALRKQEQNLQPVIAESNATIRTELAVLAFPVSKVYLESIMHNLLSNALKYRDESREPEILVKTWENDATVFLSVSDNGLGMNMENVGSKIFGLYQTFHQKKESKGLGLYLTKMQVESLGGRIMVESEQGLGTTFTVQLHRQ